MDSHLAPCAEIFPLVASVSAVFQLPARDKTLLQAEERIQTVKLARQQVLPGALRIETVRTLTLLLIVAMLFLR